VPLGSPATKRPLERDCNGNMLFKSDRTSVEKYSCSHCRFDSPAIAAQENGTLRGLGEAVRPLWSIQRDGSMI
jgi:hypothetical protein